MNATSGTILVVDDDPGIRTNTVELLELEGHQAIALPDGASALAWCQAHPGQASLVIIDLSMPGLSGTQTFHRLRGVEPQLPVVISSGSADAAILDGLLSQGLAAVLHKPVRGHVMLETVARVLKSRAS